MRRNSLERELEFSLVLSKTEGAGGKLRFFLKFGEGQMW